jgi:hypothetical protein
LVFVDIRHVRVRLVDVLVAHVQRWITATGPRHRDALLKICLRNCKVLRRNFHLLVSILWVLC